jgi:hypothetical protein
VKRYLLSQDIHTLMSAWCRGTRFKIPDEHYFDNLSAAIVDDLRVLFEKSEEEIIVQLISFREMQEGISEILMSEKNVFLVSLDKVYFQGDYQFEINRVVAMKDSVWQDTGELCRPGCKNIDEQIEEVAVRCDEREIILVDDGCWSGGSIAKIIKNLSDKDLPVKKVVVGILIKNSSSLDFGVPLSSALEFDAEMILDWICERDFIPGVPLGGRTVDAKYEACYKSSVGAYYLYGMGEYKKWASLHLDDDSVKWFTQRRLLQAIELFSEVERLSGNMVILNHLDRIPYGLGVSTSWRIVNALEKMLYQIK